MTKVYTSLSDDILILEDVTISFKPGFIYVINGKEGSGKSTLLEIIGLIDKDFYGHYELEGKEVTKLNDKERALMRQQFFGYVFSSPFLEQNLNVMENIILPLNISKKMTLAMAKEEASKLLKEYNLENIALEKVNNLDNFTKEKIALLRAIISKPKYILVDDFFELLTTEESKYILDKLKNLTFKCCIIIASNKDFVLDYVDKVYLIDDNRVKEE